VGGRYSDDWHRVHLHNPRDVVPESNMPAFPWLEKTPLDKPKTFDWVEGFQPVNTSNIQAHMKAMRTLGVPYTDEDIANAPDQLKGKTELDALIAYLQSLGVNGPKD